MTIEYIINEGFVIDGKKFRWGNDRISSREKLNSQHKEEDFFFENSLFFDGDKSFDLFQKRDIYRDINNEKNFFFLNYDKEENLESLEVHGGVKILINDAELIFKKDIKDYLNLLNSFGENYIETDEGNFLFKNLKITIANSKTKGGKGNGLSYFYAAKNIDHLIDK